MNTQRARQNWFLCFSPDGIVTRLEAVNLIRKHAAKARIFEDLEGYPALMVANKGARRLVLFTDLTDAQIRDELPTAWLREHQQADMFRDAAVAVANDEHHTPKSPASSSLSHLDVTQRTGRLNLWDNLKKTLSGLFV